MLQVGPGRAHAGHGGARVAMRQGETEWRFSLPVATRGSDGRARARPLAAKLRACAFQTIVHGDAKRANFCFAPSGRAVAAVGFQYVGGERGMKDVAYLLCGHFGDERVERRLLDGYFIALREVVLPPASMSMPSISPPTMTAPLSLSAPRCRKCTSSRTET